MTGGRAAVPVRGRDDSPPRETIRLDKWLWQARFFKTRSQSALLVSEGRVRVNSERVVKPARAVGPGDVLTFPQGGTIRVVRLLAAGSRRGPAPEAQALYEDLTPPEQAKDPSATSSANPAYDGAGRPGKRERRNMRSFGAPRGPDALE